MSLASIQSRIGAPIATIRGLLGDITLLEKVLRLAEIVVECLKAGGKVFFAGNGGSLADAQHVSGEFISRFMFNRVPLASVVPGVNNSVISAIGNDYGYRRNFARELEGLGKAGDVFIALSTRGNGPYIRTVVQRAGDLGQTTLAFTGLGGCKFAPLFDCLCVPFSVTAWIHESHIMLGHIVRGLVEERCFKESC